MNQTTCFAEELGKQMIHSYVPLFSNKSLSLQTCELTISSPAKVGVGSNSRSGSGPPCSLPSKFPTGFCGLHLSQECGTNSLTVWVVLEGQPMGGLVPKLDKVPLRLCPDPPLSYDCTLLPATLGLKPTLEHQWATTMEGCPSWLSHKSV